MSEVSQWSPVAASNRIARDDIDLTVNFARAKVGDNFAAIMAAVRRAQGSSGGVTGAVGDGVTNDAAAIQAALTAAGALATGGEVTLGSGTYNCGTTTLTVPAKVTLRLGNAKIVSGATDAIILALGAGSASGRIIGAGHSSIIQHTGSGYGVKMNGAGETSANPLIADVQIIGSSAGAGGVYATAFNGLYTRNLKVNGYTTGRALYHYGVNAVTHWSPVLEACLHGVVNTAITVGPTVYQANAIRVYGGSIVGMTGYGAIEEMLVGSQPNLGNVYDGVVFENNGVNGSGTTGHMFIQRSESMSISRCYFEDYAGTVPLHAITIGDGSNAPLSVTIADNIFSTSGTNVLNNVNSAGTAFFDNLTGGTVTNNILQGSAVRSFVARSNRAAGATNLWAGTDGGLDTRLDFGTVTNANGNSTFGYSFNSISGLAQDLQVRTRSGGTNVLTFVNAAGSTVGGINNAGELVVGANKVVGARGAALPADATDLATAIALVNAIKARMVAHGLVA